MPPFCLLLFLHCLGLNFVFYCFRLPAALKWPMSKGFYYKSLINCFLESFGFNSIKRSTTTVNRQRHSTIEDMTMNYPDKFAKSLTTRVQQFSSTQLKHSRIYKKQKLPNLIIWKWKVSAFLIELWRESETYSVCVQLTLLGCCLPTISGKILHFLLAEGLT